jgi:NADPH2:quinone reductase
MTYTAARNDLVAHAEDLFEVVLKKAVNITINQTFPLSEAASAQQALENRTTTGSTILLPG